MAISEGERQRGIGPESGSEIGREIGVAVLRGSEDSVVKRSVGEVSDVVDEDYIGIEIDNTANTEGEEVSQVATSIVQRTIQGRADGGGDQTGHGDIIEGVDFEFQVRKGGGNGGVERQSICRSRGNKMEDYILGTGRMLQNGEDRRHGAPDVSRVQCHCDVDAIVGAETMAIILALENRGAVRGVVELGCLLE